MTEDEMNMLWRMVANTASMALLIPHEDLAGLIRINERGHALGPILDPTAYRDNMEEAQNNTDLLRAFADFYAAVKPIREREMARVAAMQTTAGAVATPAPAAGRGAR